LVTDASQNQRAYTTRGVVNAYARRVPAGLTPPEEFCLGLIPPQARGSVLDIGIGAGRTTPLLSEMFGRYVGIDYSADLVAAAKSLHPHADLRVMDARQLDFGTAFDVVVFSFNGIDSVDFADRQRILAEMHRVLKPGGYLVFSTHNLGFYRVERWLSSLLVAEFLQPLHRARFVLNRLRNFSRQKRDRANDVAYINDPQLGFRFINAYVDIPRELVRLGAAGFTVGTAIGNTRVRAGYDGADCWVYLLLRKT
jgi:SAM-dependent methyltransferase